MHQFLLVTGMSGAGRSTAAAALEDAGWYVIDNMPVALIVDAADLVTHPAVTNTRVAFIIGRGGGINVSEISDTVAKLTAKEHAVTSLFLDADDDVLVRRYEGTRRRHPRSRLGVTDAITEERMALQSVRENAAITIDTSDLNSNQLRLRIKELFGDVERQASMRTSIISFGFKHGLPLDVDLVFDVRFLPNPHWEENLREFSGLDAPVRDYVFEQPETAAFLDRLVDMLEMLIPAYDKEGKSYLTVAIGCTGGRHRSVAIAEWLHHRLGEHFAPISVFHRDIDR